MLVQEKYPKHDDIQLDHSQVVIDLVGCSEKPCVDEGMIIKDEVFGEIHDGGPNFRGVSFALELS